SMGEMYFYLSLGDRTIVGGGFVTKGAHNIIEPLALKKPVIVGPHTWTISYPVEEAIAAGVCQRVASAQALMAEMQNPSPVINAQIDAFFAAHAGGVARTLAALPTALEKAQQP
ncbi:MAG: 3-deoxy-D-manno-octulosonic acid transferase, partial [Pseudomonadota bacterium]